MATPRDLSKQDEIARHDILALPSVTDLHWLFFLCPGFHILMMMPWYQPIAKNIVGFPEVISNALQMLRLFYSGWSPLAGSKAQGSSVAHNCHSFLALTNFEQLLEFWSPNNSRAVLFLSQAWTKFTERIRKPWGQKRIFVLLGPALWDGRAGADIKY